MISYYFSCIARVTVNTNWLPEEREICPISGRKHYVGD